MGVKFRSKPKPRASLARGTGVARIAPTPRRFPTRPGAAASPGGAPRPPAPDRAAAAPALPPRLLTLHGGDELPILAADHPVVLPVVVLADVELPEPLARRLRLRRVLLSVRQARAAAAQVRRGVAAAAGVRHDGRGAVTGNRGMPPGCRRPACLPGFPGCTHRVDPAQFASEGLAGRVCGRRRWSLRRCAQIAIFLLGAVYRPILRSLFPRKDAWALLTRRGGGYQSLSVPLPFTSFSGVPVAARGRAL